MIIWVKKFELIKDEIWSFVDEDGSDIIENDLGLEDIKDVVDYVTKKHNCAIEFIKVGGFNSPGCDVNCYAWAGIVDGNYTLIH